MRRTALLFAALLPACATELAPPDEPTSDGPQEGDTGLTRIRRGDGSVHEVHYVVHGGRMIWQGDIDLGPVPAHRQERSLAIKGMDHRWPGGRVDWEFEPGSIVPQATIRAAIAIWEAETPIRFHEGREPGRPFIQFQDSGTPNVSRTTGIGPDGIDADDCTDVQIQASGATVATVQHELGHAIGLDHEAERSDRDLEISFDSSCSTADYNFWIDGSSYELFGKYDLDSIMQYPSTNFCEQADPGEFHTAQGNCTCYPIVLKGTSHTAENGVISRSGKFSPGDLRALQRMYEPRLGFGGPTDKLGAATVRGDFNNDGFEDLAVGAPGKTSAQGAVELYMGTEVGLVAWKQLDASALGAVTSGERFGAALAAADFDGDGFDDLIVGAPGRNVNGAVVAGAVFVYFGGRGGPMPAAGKIITQAMLGSVDEWGDEFGASLLGANLSGDGHPELVIGAPSKKVTGVRTGVVYLASVNPAARSFSGWRFLVEPGPGAAAGDRFGHALAAGDFDANGIVDLAVGAPGSSLSTKPGTVFVYDILSNVLAGAWAIHEATRGAQASNSGDQFGTSLAVGHFDASVYPGTTHRMLELVVGAPGKDTPVDSGRIFTYRPYYDGWDSFAGFTQTGMLGQTAFPGGVNSAGDALGTAVAAADFDHDGFDDVVVGAPLRDNGASLADQGAVFLFRGGASLTGYLMYLENPLSVNQANDQLGTSLATGDFDRDGTIELVAGAVNHMVPQAISYGGAVYQYPGSVGFPFVLGNVFDQSTQSPE